MFDVTGDGHIEAKEFAFVSTKMAHKSGGFGSYTDTDQEKSQLRIKSKFHLSHVQSKNTMK